MVWSRTGPQRPIAGKSLTLVVLKRQSEQHRKQIESQIAAIVDREWMSVLDTNSALKAKLDILLSIPGVGAATAIAFLVDMPELGSMDAKQAASLAGLAPVTRQSGTWRGKSFIQGGRATLRQAIYMPALVAIRFNPPLKETYEALCRAGKPAKLAIVAIMRKIVITANALIRDNCKWTLDDAAASCPSMPPTPSPRIETGRIVEGTRANLSGRDRGQAPKPRSGASKAPGD